MFLFIGEDVYNELRLCDIFFKTAATLNADGNPISLFFKKVIPIYNISLKQRTFSILLKHVKFFINYYENEIQAREYKELLFPVIIYRIRVSRYSEKNSRHTFIHA